MTNFDRASACHEINVGIILVYRMYLNEERGTGNGERGTGNGERGTENVEWKMGKYFFRLNVYNRGCIFSVMIIDNYGIFKRYMAK